MVLQRSCVCRHGGFSGNYHKNSEQNRLFEMIWTSLDLSDDRLNHIRLCCAFLFLSILPSLREVHWVLTDSLWKAIVEASLKGHAVASICLGREGACVEPVRPRAACLVAVDDFRFWGGSPNLFCLVFEVMFCFLIGKYRRNGKKKTTQDSRLTPFFSLTQILNDLMFAPGWWIGSTTKWCFATVIPRSPTETTESAAAAVRIWSNRRSNDSTQKTCSSWKAPEKCVDLSCRTA